MTGVFAAFIMWTLVRALRQRVIFFSDGIGCDIHHQPVKFASTAAMHCMGALLFAWLAAGGISHFYRLILAH